MVRNTQYGQPLLHIWLIHYARDTDEGLTTIYPYKEREVGNKTFEQIHILPTLAENRIRLLGNQFFE